jgi:hypothetical protein
MPTPSRAYAGPLMEPPPVTEEAGIPIPPHVGRRDHYDTRQWSAIADTWSPTGHLVSALHDECSALLRPHDQDAVNDRDQRSPSSIHWHVRAAGRRMRQRLAIEGRIAMRNQDGLRLAIQDTWVPAVTRLRSAAAALATVTTGEDAQQLLTDSVITCACLRGLPGGRFWRSRSEEQADDARLASLNHQEVVWAVVAADPPAWTDRALLGVVRQALNDADGTLMRVAGGPLIGGLPIHHDTHYRCHDASDLVGAAIRGLWAQTAQTTSPPPADLRTAAYAVLATMAPALADGVGSMKDA